MTDSRMPDQARHVESLYRRWLPLTGVWCLYFAFGLNMASLAPLVAVIESDLGMRPTQMGTVLGASSDKANTTKTAQAETKKASL